MMDLALFPDNDAYVLADATLPAADGSLLRRNLVIEGGRIAAISERAPDTALPVVALDGAMVWPAMADIHTHLDKGFIWDRTPNPDGTFMGALQAVNQDREAYWSTEDVRRRMTFALRCAYAHGTQAVRTHLDTMGTHGQRVWPLIRDMQAQWAGRIALQAVSLVMPQSYAGEDGERIARDVASTPGACLGAVLMHDNATPEHLERLFALAERFGCGLDLHVDENNVRGGTALQTVAETVMRRRFRLPVLCGHCCSLSVQDAPRQAEIVKSVADAGIGIVSLPMCNMYLQDRTPGRTPLWRGVTMVHELHAAGVPVMFASDNTRDPFYAYGDLDMAEVFSQAVRIAHLDHPFGGWWQSVSVTPARWMGLDTTLRAGSPADLVIFAARDMNQLVTRPTAPRAVIRHGRAIDARAPSYAEL
ncbi:cytosine deaminase [Komagataeibacter oboediens]|uniref:cytosine deaminase n=1 Tax=Komagataeibacter oboediens TaxID=65958 RepID=UPI001C2C5632|nr:cytosine deaminase [Komagataeibacter oboediens]MBV0888748.1 cytosine deaminase [Komagataeibacter oboediens]MCK9821273.1 cytosine deaminase [Komagataeibacter oboediens]